MLVFVQALAAAPVDAQTPSPGPLPAPVFERPSDRLPPADLPTPEQDRERYVLPPIPPPSQEAAPGGESPGLLVLSAIRFVENTAIPSADLERGVEPFLELRLDAEGLEALRRHVTQLYVTAGFINSGAVIPPQSVTDGVLEIQIVEGALERVELFGLSAYRADVVRDRILRHIDAPLDVADVDLALRLLDQDPRIERIDARLRPGSRRDRAVLELTVEEARPHAIEFGFDNHESPSVGAFAGRLRARHDNVLGYGDDFRFSFTRTEGLSRLNAAYALPVHVSGTALVFEASYGEAELVDNQLKALDIGSVDWSVSLGLRQTLWHTPTDRVDWTMLLDVRRSETFIFGNQPFSFLTNGPEDGRSELRVVRSIVEWTHRAPATVVALRSMASFGTGFLDATTETGERPDGEFVSWYAQARGLHRFDRGGIELSLRADFQLANRPLLPLEQFAIGGAGNVRGYRRNQIVADQGVATGVDLRVPVWRRDDATTLLALTPFIDFGYAWNRDRETPGIRTLSSIGLGFEWTPHPSLAIGIDLAHGFRNTGDSGDLQDRSVHLGLTWRAW